VSAPTSTGRSTTQCSAADCRGRHDHARPGRVCVLPALRTSIDGAVSRAPARREPTRCVHGRRMAIGSRAAGHARIGRGARTGLGERGTRAL
jgi:hypothetical protein